MSAGSQIASSLILNGRLTPHGLISPPYGSAAATQDCAAASTAGQQPPATRCCPGTGLVDVKAAADRERRGPRIAHGPSGSAPPLPDPGSGSGGGTGGHGA